MEFSVSQRLERERMDGAVLRPGTSSPDIILYMGLVTSVLLMRRNCKLVDFLNTLLSKSRSVQEVVVQ